MENKWLTWARKILTISQAGLTYCENIYDKERYEQLKDITAEIFAAYTDVDKDGFKAAFPDDAGYLTPKLDIRAAIFKDNKILMVREKSDKCWALPGGWADVGLSPSENIIKEVKEEAGFDIKPLKLISLFDKKCHPHPPYTFSTYKITFLCEITGGTGTIGTETDELGFFASDNLPPLSQTRNTYDQIKQIFEFCKEPEKSAVFD